MFTQDVKDVQVQSVPYDIGIIWYLCSLPFKVPNVTTYSAVILNNFTYTDNNIDRPVDIINNINTKYAITNTTDEQNFYRVHIAIEKTGSHLIESMYYVADHVTSKTDFITFLENVATTIKNMRDVMLQMHTLCNPNVFWNQVRVYLGGYTADNGLPNGLRVDGTDLAFNFGGGSGAQSTLIHAIDIFFNIEHGIEHATKFLADQRVYMPIKHQRYLSDLARIHENDYIKNKVIAFNDPDIINAYNDAVRALIDFRSTHYTIVHRYVVRYINAAKAGVNADDINRNNIHGTKGSGGLVISVLVDFINNTRRGLIGETINSVDVPNVLNKRCNRTICLRIWCVWLVVFASYIIMRWFM
jgi:indoleamine 2,3-dioxygenase